MEIFELKDSTRVNTETTVSETLPVYELGSFEPVAEIPARPAPDQMYVWREELHGYFAAMRQFNVMDAVDVFEHLSAFSARASEIRNLCMEMDSRRNNNFRIREIDPFIEECDRQFKIHSRILSVKEVEARLAGGSFA